MDVNFEKEFAFRKSHDPIPLTRNEENEVMKVELGSPKKTMISSS
jgi:hypothetical protein